MIRMTGKYLSALLLGAGLSFCHTHIASAAPFCTQITGMAPECIYYDAMQCRARATQLKAVCVANPAEPGMKTGNQHYCLVTGGNASMCLYVDRADCEKDAIAEGQAACVENLPAGQTPDLYHTEPGRRY